MAKSLPSAVIPSPSDAQARSQALDRLLNPSSIAIIGASSNPSKRGYHAIRALQEAGYAHPIYPVNPRPGDILGLPVTTAILDLPRGIDAALIALPGHAVPDALRDCAQVGISGAVVLANGFKEIGQAGAALERELQQALAETGLRVIGPNTSGMLNVSTGANLVGLADVTDGPIGIITQSGNMLLSIVNDDRQFHGPGIHAYVGLGNQSDVSYAECISALARQPETGAIALYSEGLRDGRELLQVISAVTLEKPIVLLRGGRSEAGQRTALSHTGSIAGSDAVATAVLQQAGAELVARSDELAMLSGVLATTAPVPAGRGVAVLSDGGGHAALAADALAAASVPLAQLSAVTQTRLRELLGSAAALHNPVDVAGATDADPSVFADCVQALAQDPRVGLVLVTGLYGGYHIRFDPRLSAIENQTSQAVAKIANQQGIPVLVQSCYAAREIENHQILRESGIRVLASIDQAVRAVAALYRRGKRLATAHQRSNLRLPRVASASREATSQALDEPAARRLVEKAGLDVGPWEFARNAEEAARAVERMGVPCALKVVSAQVLHKSDAGGVVLNVRAADARERAEAMLQTVQSQVAGAKIDGMVVVPMAAAGVELLIGATRDPIFGPVVAFGLGGVLVEAVADVTFRAAPFTRLEAQEMIAETLASRMLDGYRHLPAVGREALADFLVRVGDMIVRQPRISELDFNPVIASGELIRPVDVRIIFA